MLDALKALSLVATVEWRQWCAERVSERSHEAGRLPYLDDIAPRNSARKLLAGEQLVLWADCGQPHHRESKQRNDEDW